MRRGLIVLVALATTLIGLVALPSGAGAQVSDGAAPRADRAAVPKATLRDGDPNLGKLDSDLLRARLADREGLAATDILDEMPHLPLKGGMVTLDITVDLDAGALDALEDAGLVVDHAYPQYGRVSGRAALSSLAAIAAIPEVHVVHQEAGAMVNVGATTSQGDGSMNTDDARATYGIDGSGVTVGVLSDSFDKASTGTTSGAGCARATTGTASQGSGDLPASVGNILDFVDPSGIDEGRAMAELIADVAPGADIMFHTAFVGGQAGFATGITALVDCGADIVVDDVIYFFEPMFQDGVIAQAAQEATDAGIPFFSSAGNQGTFGIDDTFVDVSGASGGFGDDFHDFGGGDAFASITLDPGEGVRVVMQWNEPYDSASGPDGTPGNSGAGALNDYDIYLFDTPSAAGGPDSALAFSENFQGCALGAGLQGGDPLEMFTFANPTGSAKTYYLAISQFCAGASAGDGEHLRIATFGFGNSITAVDFEAGIFTDKQIYGHAAAKDAVAVAAMDFCEIDLGGGLSGAPGTLDVEAFSSLGGDIPIYFNPDGTPIPGGPELRAKPEITAPDGTNTTFFGGSHAVACGENDGFPNFFGTSAAAPHAAAAAALLLDYGGTTPHDAVLETLSDSAVDAETPGFDFLSGAGVIDLSLLPATCGGAIITIDGTGGDDNLTGTAKDDVIRGKGGNDTLSGKGGNDVLCGGTGNDILIGGRGDDRLLGDQGVDTVDYSASPGPVNVNLQLKRATGHGTDRLEKMENIIGTAFDDTLRGNAKRNVIEGRGGDDGINGLGGDDDLLGQAGADNLNGRRGDDLLNGGGGTDQATFIHAPGPATVDLAITVPQVTGDGSDRLINVENLFGSRFADTLFGDSGANVIKGSKGGDDLFGRAGNDELLGNQGNDSANGGPGNADRCVAETEVNCEL